MDINNLEYKKLMQKLLNKKIFKSVFYNEQELINSIIILHCNEKDIELDPMYNKGMFYKDGTVKKPRLKFDIDPLKITVKQSDATNLPLKNNSIGSMILDPPFLFGIHGKTEEYSLSKRYGILKDFNVLVKLYNGILQEAFRILKNKGILIFKCQDFTDTVSTFTHCFVYCWALAIGFSVKDLCLLVKKNKVFNPNLKQRHYRKIHSYFWVFQK